MKAVSGETNEVIKCPTVVLVKSPHIKLMISKKDREQLANHKKKLKNSQPIKQFGKSYYCIFLIQQTMFYWLTSINTC